MVRRLKGTDEGRVQAEYNRLVEGLTLRRDLSSKYKVKRGMWWFGLVITDMCFVSAGTYQWLANPILPHDILQNVVQGILYKLRILCVFYADYYSTCREADNVEKESIYFQ